MMQLYGALILCVTLSAARGLRCYTCLAADPESCIDTKACTVLSSRCYTVAVGKMNMVTKGCILESACGGGNFCCEGDLCNSGNDGIATGNDAIATGNGAIPTGSSTILLLVSSAILKFLF